MPVILKKLSSEINFNFIICRVTKHSMTPFEQASLIVTAVLTTATNLRISMQTSLGAFVWNSFFESFAQNCRTFRIMNCKQKSKKT